MQFMDKVQERTHVLVSFALSPVLSLPILALTHALNVPVAFERAFSQSLMSSLSTMRRIRKVSLFVRSSRSSRESIKRNCFYNVAVRALYSSLTLMKTRIIHASTIRIEISMRLYPACKKSEIKVNIPSLARSC